MLFLLNLYRLLYLNYQDQTHEAFLRTIEPIQIVVFKSKISFDIEQNEVLNLYRLLYLNQYRLLAQLPFLRIEPIQIVVFK